MKNWFAKGFDVLDEIKAKNTDIKRFYLKRGETADIIFLDDEPFIVKEHAIWTEDDFGNQRVRYFTCCRDVEGRCPLCEAGNRYYNIGYFTIIDERTFTDRNGNQLKGGKKLFGAKVQVLETLKNKKRVRGSFAKRKVVVFRPDANNSPTSGSDFEILEQVNVNEEPFDYVKEFEPKSYNDLLNEYRMLRLSTRVVNNENNNPAIGQEDEIDF